MRKTQRKKEKMYKKTLTQKATKEITKKKKTKQARRNDIQQYKTR
jgi:hypothetical protein